MEDNFDVKPKKTRQKKLEGSTRFELKLTAEEKEMLDIMANESDKTRSDHVRRALLAYYNAGYWRKR